MATANGFALNSAEIEIPYRRIWTARLTFTDEAGPAPGERVTIAIGSLTLVGTCIASGAHGGVFTARVVAGAGGWRRAPAGLQFQNDANLSASEVAKALASSVGETIEASAATLGINWSFDPLASAGENLDAIGHWYVREDGVTVVGTRADGATFKAIVEPYEGLEGRAVCLIEEADCAKLLPGSIVSSLSVPTLIPVRHARIVLNPRRLVVEVYPYEQVPDRLAARSARKQRFLGTYLYRVINQVSGRLQLQAVKAIDGLPDQILVPKTHGLPGVLSECTQGGLVLVVFADGNRSQPFVSAYLGNSQGETFTAPSIKFTTSSPLPSTQPVALAPAVDSILSAVSAFATACKASADVAVQGAAVALETALGAVDRTGSIVVEAQ